MKPIFFSKSWKIWRKIRRLVFRKKIRQNLKNEESHNRQRNSENNTYFLVRVFKRKQWKLGEKNQNQIVDLRTVWEKSRTRKKSKAFLCEISTKTRKKFVKNTRTGWEKYPWNHNPQKQFDEPFFRAVVKLDQARFLLVSKVTFLYNTKPWNYKSS